MIGAAEGSNHARRELAVRFGPAEVPIEFHVVSRRRSGRQSFNDDEGVVVPGDGERFRFGTENADPARNVGFYENRCRGLVDESKHRADQ